jgi:hypothetical protein
MKWLWSRDRSFHEPARRATRTRAHVGDLDDSSAAVIRRTRVARSARRFHQAAQAPANIAGTRHIACLNEGVRGPLLLANRSEVKLRKAVIILGALMVLSAPVFAYVQPGSLAGTTKVKEGGPAPKEQSDGSPGSDGAAGPIYPEIPITTEPVTDEAVKPVPEPATMALASMGLLAVGAALRKRRSR